MKGTCVCILQQIKSILWIWCILHVLATKQLVSLQYQQSTGYTEQVSPSIFIHFAIPWRCPIYKYVLLVMFCPVYYHDHYNTGLLEAVIVDN